MQISNKFIFLLYEKSEFNLHIGFYNNAIANNFSDYETSRKHRQK